jgi:C-terminal processing protease CtpA/Prc
MCVYAQHEPISEREKNQAIDSIVGVLTKYYVLPDKGNETANYLLQQRKKNAYKNIANYSAFIEQVNKDLQVKHKDLHLKVNYNPEKVALIRKVNQQVPDSTFFVKRAAKHRYFNYGVAKVERLEGNITYIDLRQFVNVTNTSRKTIDAALTLNQEPTAIIIDLRENGGGNIDMGRYIKSYFFQDSIHLTDVINRITNTKDKYWTHPSLIDQKFIKTPIYILISGNTFSAAEEFAYNLKNMKRAVIVGEKSAGGAHGYGSKAINNAIVISIPFERIENAITKDNWEGVGVVPDIVIPSSKALEKAHLMAMDTIRLQIDDEEVKQELKWKKEYLQVVVTPVVLNQELLQSYTGNYGSREILLLDDGLYMQRKDKSKYRLIPINDNTFYIKELNYRLQFLKTKEDKMKLYIVFEDGYKQEVG